MLELIRKFVHDEDGQGMAEYGLILALVAVAAITALGLLGTELGELFEYVQEQLDFES